jgi:hypothetical protein
MLRFFLSAMRPLASFFGSVVDLIGDGLRFFCQAVRSHSALSAEILFLRKQLAFYEERQTEPRRLTDSARASLVIWSRLFEWKDALVIVKPETLIAWHRNGFKLFWRWKSQAGRPRPLRPGFCKECVNAVNATSRSTLAAFSSRKRFPIHTLYARTAMPLIEQFYFEVCEPLPVFSRKRGLPFGYFVTPPI